MSYYVRKIARAKWSRLNADTEDTVYNYRADTVANDLHIIDNTLSLWKITSFSDQDVKPIIAINSLLSDRISKMDLLFVPEEMVAKYTISQKSIQSALEKQDDRHYDIVDLTVRSLLEFADKVVIKILNKEVCKKDSSEMELVRTVSKQEQIQIIMDLLDTGKLNEENLKENQRKEISKVRDGLKSKGNS